VHRAGGADGAEERSDQAGEGVLGEFGDALADLVAVLREHRGHRVGDGVVERSHHQRRDGRERGGGHQAVVPGGQVDVGPLLHHPVEDGRCVVLERLDGVRDGIDGTGGQDLQHGRQHDGFDLSGDHPGRGDVRRRRGNHNVVQRRGRRDGREGDGSSACQRDAGFDRPMKPVVRHTFWTPMHLL
jgi:hypothetical protein